VINTMFLTSSEGNCQSGLRYEVLSQATDGAIGVSRENPPRPQQALFRPGPPTLLPLLSLLPLKPNPVTDSLARKIAIEHCLLFYLELALGSAPLP